MQDISRADSWTLHKTHYCEIDCGTIKGVSTSALKEAEDIKEPLTERILGRVSLQDIIDPISNSVIVRGGELIDEDKAQQISETSIETVIIRSVLTCDSRRGVCANVMVAILRRETSWSQVWRLVLLPHNQLANLVHN